MKKLLVVLFLLTAGVSAHSQTGIYGEFSAADYHRPTTNWQYGPTFGLYSQPLGVPFVRAGFDIRGSFLGKGNEKVDSILGGLRVQVHPHVVPLMPYGEALAGVAHVNVGQGSANTTGTGVEYQLVGGLDVTLLPHLDWRAIEYSWSSVHAPHSVTFEPQAISTGVVLRLP
ncbi:MAG TPA: hypothetical protein VHE33_02450 [Acidobacteriaceae bacterium]|nr:hypothetical protein [Acidobacteriaceae bacterium]